MLCQHVAEEFTVRTAAQADGAVSNLQAHRAMNSAILQARSQPDHAVIMVNAHHARVKSASDESQEYDVQLPLDIAREVTCNCQAGHFRKMCWHVAKVLMLKGASDKLLLRHMGILLGSDQGGYHALEVAMAAAAAAANEVEL